MNHADEDVPGFPTSNRDQSCAFCGAQRPELAHRMDPRFIGFRCYGEGYTLPNFWPTCAECESFIREGEDVALLAQLDRQAGLEELSAAMLDAFREADLGPRPLVDHR